MRLLWEFIIFRFHVSFWLVYKLVWSNAEQRLRSDETGELDVLNGGKLCLQAYNSQDTTDNMKDTYWWIPASYQSKGIVSRVLLGERSSTADWKLSN